MHGPSYCMNCGATTHVGKKDGKVTYEAKPTKITMDHWKWCDHCSDCITNKTNLGWFCSPKCMVEYVVDNQDDLKKNG